MNIYKLLLAMLLLFVVTGCSEEVDDKANAKAKNDLIWKEQQTRAIEKVKEAEKVMLESTKRRMEQVEKQSK